MLLASAFLGRGFVLIDLLMSEDALDKLKFLDFNYS